MKKIIFIFAGIFLFANTYSQTKPKAPKNMYYVPSGTLELKDDSLINKISVQGFFMSNEITNKQYRAFTDYVMLHLNDSICWVEMDSHNMKDPFDQKNMIAKKVCSQYSSFSNNLIDSTIMEKAAAVRYKNYFTDIKFDEYPVVGVSFNQATMYCRWRSILENGNSVIRLPMWIEWQYASEDLKSYTEPITNFILPSNEGVKNSYGLSNLTSNVSELSASFRNENVVLAGGSPNWKLAIEISKDSKSELVGFRVIQTFIGRE